MKDFPSCRARLTGERLDVYDGLRRYGPQTVQALAAAISLHPSAVANAFTELSEAFHVRRTSKRDGAEYKWEALTASEAEAAFEAARGPQDVRGPALWIPAPKRPEPGEQIALF